MGEELIPPEDAVMVASLTAAVRTLAGCSDANLMHVIVLGELFRNGKAMAFGGSTGPLIETQKQQIAYIDYHLCMALEQSGQSWEEYRLHGTERPPAP